MLKRKAVGFSSFQFASLAIRFDKKLLRPTKIFFNLENRAVWTKWVEGCNAPLSLFNIIYIVECQLRIGREVISDLPLARWTPATDETSNGFDGVHSIALLSKLQRCQALLIFEVRVSTVLK